MGWFKKSRNEELKNVPESVKRQYRCAFTGHRPEKVIGSEGRIIVELRREIEIAIDDGYKVFLTGMCRGVFDFVGMVFPKTDTMTTGDAQLDKEREMIMGMGGINYTNVAKIMNLPDLEDMDFDPCGVFQNLTGIVNEEVTSRDCMAVVMDMVAEKIKALSKPAEGEQSSGQTYTYVETDFIKALKNGYLLEIQEPTVIMQPGVLVGLNSLLEQGGSITLPTGEVIQRHPDTVIVVTTNVTYEGCRGLNRATRSVLKRCGTNYISLEN